MLEPEHGPHGERTFLGPQEPRVPCGLRTATATNAVGYEVGTCGRVLGPARAPAPQVAFPARDGAVQFAAMGLLIGLLVSLSHAGRPASASRPLPQQQSVALGTVLLLQM